MELKKIIPAAAAAGREGLELSLTRAGDARGAHLVLEAGGGSVLLVLGPKDGEFLFSYGKVTLRPAGDGSGAAFVDAVAGWLNLEMAFDKSTPAESASSVSAKHQDALEARWVRLGDGEDQFGTGWQTFKLFFTLGERHAELFLRLSRDGTRAQFVEKWSEYRYDLLAIFEHILSDRAPRRVGPPSSPLTGPSGELLLSVDGALELAVPLGWGATERDGHWRLADPEDEMMIEFSYLRLPPLPADFPSVTERLRPLLEESEHKDSTSPIQAFERHEVAFAWSEYRFDSHDTKRPKAAKRPARGRYLIASNEWVQVLVTACWWEADVAVAERAWNDVVASLRLMGRIAPPVQRGAEA